MGEDFDSENAAMQDAREALLKYYTSECVEHGAYILTTVIAFFTAVQASSVMGLDGRVGIWILWLLLVSFSLVGIYFLGRIFFWAWLAGTVLWVRPLTKQEVMGDVRLGNDIRQGNASYNDLGRLHEACYIAVTKNHRNISPLVATPGASSRFLVFGVFVLLLTIIFLILFA